MAASNRAKLIQKLHTELKKRYSLPPAQPSRPLLEHLLYACLLQDAPDDLADEGFAKCEQEFFDWNEVRVTTVTELSQVLSAMPEPAKTARRLKETLQAVFEEFYSFDLDHLKKENLGKAVAKLETMPAVTPFVLSYTIQHGLGGHSIPIDYAAMVIMLSTEIASQSEAASGRIPGLERAVPKTKGIEFSSLLHQAGVALMLDHKDKKARALIDAVSKGSSQRYDEWEASKKAAIRRVKRRRRAEKAQQEAEAADAEPAAPAEKPKKKAAGKEATEKEKTGSKKSKTATSKKASKKSTAKTQQATASKTGEGSKKAAASKKKSASKKAANKSSKKSSKKASSKATPPKSSSSGKKSANRKLSKRKPR
jgi:endonuclease-3